MNKTFKYLKEILKIGKPYNKYMIGFIIGSIFGVVVHIVFPFFMAKQILSISTNELTGLLMASFGVLIICVLDHINAGIMITRNTQFYFRGVTKDVQTKLSKEILKISTSDIDNSGSGIFIQRLTSDSETLGHVVTKCTGYITGIVAQIGTFIAAIILFWQIGLYYLVTSVFITFLYVIYSKKEKKQYQLYRKQNDKLTSITSELIRGIREIKMLNSKSIYLNKLENNIDLTADRLFDSRELTRTKNMTVGIINQIVNLFLVVIIIFYMKVDLLHASTALILFNYHESIYGNLMTRVNNLISELNQFTISAERVFDIINGKSYKKEKFGKTHIENCKGVFEFNNVKFGYNDDKLVLNNLNLAIKDNKTYGIVGKSGEGKTTIFNLLCKMYDIESGNITIENININELDEDSIRGNITIISQNPYIFNLSIKENLQLVKENVTDDEIKEACKLACLDDFIETLPDKYDTVVGESGVTLSGGQRQRLAIARALIQNTKIILFDEATSALDNETQIKIQEAIDNLKGNYTIVIIAHRLSTIINCDEIFFMKDGKIENKGTHEELLKECKSYKDLYEYEIKSNN